MKWAIIIILSVAIMVGGWYLYKTTSAQVNIAAAVNRGRIPAWARMVCDDCKKQNIPASIWKLPMQNSPVLCTVKWGELVGVTAETDQYYRVVANKDCIGYVDKRLIVLGDPIR